MRCRRLDRQSVPLSPRRPRRLELLRERLFVVDLRGERTDLCVGLAHEVRHDLGVLDGRLEREALGVATSGLEHRRGRRRGRVIGVDREIERPAGSRLDVAPVLVDVEFQFLGFEQHAVSEDGAEVETDLFRFDTEFVQDVREFLGDFLAGVKHRRVRKDLNGAFLNACVGTHALEFADERTGVDARVAFRNHDIVRGHLAGTDGCGRLGGLEFLKQRERVVVGPDEPDLPGDVAVEVFESVVDFVKRTLKQRVPGDAKFGGPVQVTSHVL